MAHKTFNRNVAQDSFYSVGVWFLKLCTFKRTSTNMRRFKLRHFEVSRIIIQWMFLKVSYVSSKLQMSDCRMQNKFIMLRIFLRLALQERNLLSFLCQFGWQMHKIWQEAMDSLTARLALAQEHASKHFLQKILTGIFRTTQELTLPKCKRHLHKISREFSQNILLTRMQHTTLLMSHIINLCASFKKYLNYLLNVNKEPQTTLDLR